MPPIVSRSDWGAKPAKSALQRIVLPSPRLWLHHTASEGWHGAEGMRAIQRFHQTSRGWIDIGYSLVIDAADCTVYEGRGVGMLGAHTEGDNDESHGICVMGDFALTRPSDQLLQTIADLVADGHRKGWWPGEISGGHRDAPDANTACPGGFLWEQIPNLNRAIAAQLKHQPPHPSEDDDMAFDDKAAAELKEIGRLVRGMNHQITVPGVGLQKLLKLAGEKPANLDPDDLAAAITDDLGDDVARKVLDGLTARLAG